MEIAMRKMETESLKEKVAYYLTLAHIPGSI